MYVHTYSFKSYCSIVILHLANDDFAAADEANKQFCAATPAFERSDEGGIAIEFLSAFENLSSEALENAKKENQLKFLEPQVYHIAKNLKLSGISLQPRKPQAENVSTQLAQSKHKLLFDNMNEVDDDGCDENGVPVRREVDLTGADDDLTGAPPPQRHTAQEEDDIFDGEDLT